MRQDALQAGVPALNADKMMIRKIVQPLKQIPGQMRLGYPTKAQLSTGSMAASQPPLRARAPAQPGPVTQLDQQTASQVPATGFSAHQRQEISYQAAKSETRAAPRLTHPRTDVPASHAHKRCETPRCAFFTATLLGHSHLNGRPIQLLARDAYKNRAVFTAGAEQLT